MFQFHFILLVMLAIRTSMSSSCTSSSSCLYGLVCRQGTCQSCQSNDQCVAANFNKPYCRSYLIWSICQQCTSNSQCTDPSKPRCSNNACTSCSSNNDCSLSSGNRKKCQSGTCVECTGNSDCASNSCDLSTNQCTGSSCTSYLDCGVSTLPACVSSTCRSCVTDETVCTSASKLCASDGSCQVCSQDQDCTDPLNSQCVAGPPIACSRCTDNSHCSHISGKTKCSTSLGCVECLSSTDCDPGDSCTNNQCVAPSQPLTIKVSTTSADDTYLIVFPSQLVENTDPLQGISILLVGIDTSTYKYTVTKISTTNYEVQFTVTQTIPPAQLQLTYTYTPYGSSSDYIAPQYEAETTTKRMSYIPANQKAVAAAMQAVGQAATTAMAASSGSIMILGGNPAILWALINMIQAFYYLMFVNVNYPANVQFFFQIFTVAGFDWIPNPIAWLNPDLVNETLSVPARFEEYGVNGLFLDNAGNMLLIWFAAIAIYAFSALGRRYLNRLTRLGTLFFSKMVSWFEWGGVLRALTTSYPDIIQAAFLQLRVLTYDNSSYTASSVTGIIFSVFGVTFPFLTYLMIKKFVNTRNRNWRKFKTLTEEYRHEGPMSKYFTAIFLGKRLFINLSLVFLHEYPYIEIFILTSICVATIGLIVKYKPYETKAGNYINITMEMLFLGVHVIIMILVFDDYNERFSDNERLNLGWALIAICGVIVLINIGVTVAEQAKMIKESVKLIRLAIQKGRTKQKTLQIKKRIIEDQPVIVDASNISINNVSDISASNLSAVEKNLFVDIPRRKKLVF